MNDLIAYPFSYPRFDHVSTPFLTILVYRAVTWTREATRRGVPPAEGARCACRLLGVEDEEHVAELAECAEDGCRAARLTLRINGEGI
jgi:hypothetical protein